MLGTTPIFSQWNTPDTYIRSLVVAPNGSGGTNVFAGIVEADVYWGIEAGVYISTDSGASWTQVSTGLTASVVHALSVSPNGIRPGTNLFVGTNAGVFLSTNNGTNWSAASTGLPLTHINGLEYAFPLYIV
jgi:ligand-binding sensor domain-containing protein